MTTYIDGYGGDTNSAFDLLMSDGWATHNGGAHASLNLDRPRSPNTTGRQKAFLRFLLSAIPEGSTCNSAILHLFHDYNAEAGYPFTGTAYAITEANGDWVEGTKDIALAGSGEPCWNAKEADGSGGVTTAWAGSAGCSTSGTDFVATAVGEVAMNPADAIGTEYQMSLDTDLVETWFGSNDDNFGIVMWAVGNGQIHLGSAESATTGYRPYLVVDYTAPESGVVADLSATLDDATLVAACDVAVSGALSATLPDAIITATGGVAVVGNLSVMLEDVVISSAGKVGIVGQAAVTLEDVALSASAAVAVAGALSSMLEDVVLSAGGGVGIVAALSAVLADATLIAEGTVSEPPIVCTLFATLDDATLVAYISVVTQAPGELAISDNQRFGIQISVALLHNVEISDEQGCSVEVTDE